MALTISGVARVIYQRGGEQRHWAKLIPLQLKRCCSRAVFNGICLTTCLAAFSAWVLLSRCRFLLSGRSHRSVFLNLSVIETWLWYRGWLLWPSSCARAIYWLFGERCTWGLGCHIRRKLLWHFGTYLDEGQISGRSFLTRYDGRSLTERGTGDWSTMSGEESVLQDNFRCAHRF